MATMLERQIASENRELAKIEKSLVRRQGLLEKKTAACEKLNCNWTDEEMRERIHVSGDYTAEQWNAWFKRQVEQSQVDDLLRRMGIHKRDLAKLEGRQQEVRTEQEEKERVQSIEVSFLKEKEDYEAWLAEFKAECLKDGIVIKDIDNWHICGTDASGRDFWLMLNNGVTKRSFHCYSLTVGGDMVFTSGDFSTAYAYLR